MSASKMLRALCALLLLTAPSAFSQTGGTASNSSQTSNQETPARRPAFVGTWIPRGEKDKMPDAGPDGWTKVNIEQHDDALKFSVVHAVGSKSKNYELIYYTDGRGETNSGMVYYFIVANSQVAGKEVKSKTSWDGDALVVVHRVSMPDQPIPGGVVYTSLDVTMRWQVSPNGKLLTRTTKQSNFSAFFRQLIAGEFKDTDLTINQPQNAESNDTYVLLEAKH